MQPRLTTLTKKSWEISEWSGGKTAQFAIAPEGAVYQNRDFLWRLSSATVELEQSDFTALPDYTRLISVLKGEMCLFSEGEQLVSLAPYTVYSFDGESPIRSEGRCTDFNLMLRKNRCEGSLQVCRMQAGTLAISAAISSPVRYQNRMVFLFCAEGEATLSTKGCFATVSAGQLVLAEELGASTLCISCTQDLVLMIAQVEW